MYRKTTSVLLTELEALGALDHMEFPFSSWFTAPKKPEPSASVRPVVEPRAVQTPEPPPNEELKTLAQSLEVCYGTLREFWTNYGEQLQSTYAYPGVNNDFLRKMRQLNGNFEWVMGTLRKGQSPGPHVTLDGVSLLMQAIIRQQSIDNINFSVEFSGYMIALRSAGDILYDHLKMLASAAAA